MDQRLITLKEINQIRHCAEELVQLSDIAYGLKEKPKDDYPLGLQVHRDLRDRVLATADELEAKLHV